LNLPLDEDKVVKLIINKKENMKTLKSLSLPVIFVIIVAFTIGNKYVSEVNEEDRLGSHAKSSITLENGRYKVDSNFIARDFNKAALLEDLRIQVLFEKKKVAEIPAFIKTFLDSVTEGKKFEIADPNEEWHPKDITYFASPSTSNCDMRRLPNRQLVYFGMGKNMALMSFYNGELMIRYEALIIRFEGEKITDFWYNRGMPYVWTKEKILESLTRNEGGC
jgi:hypothetical protein